MEEISKPNLMIVMFTYDGNCKSTMWTHAFQLASEGWQFNTVKATEYRGYPVTRLRNRALKEAKEQGFQYVLFLDADMALDAYLNSEGNDFEVKPFLTSSYEFMKNYGKPCVVAAPYCGPPPLQNVYVMDIHDDTYSGDPEGRGTSLSVIRREDAARRTGIEQVTALPTGCMLIDTRIVDIWKKTTNNTPMFRYRYKDDEQTELASTEDTVFTRDLTDLGIPCFVNWHSWAVHWKEWPIGKPSKTPVRDNVSKAVYNAITHGEWKPNVEK